ncbi:MAG: hypothetical protein ABEL76_11160 [Bradymonadaceae bacterium]
MDLWWRVPIDETQLVPGHEEAGRIPETCGRSDHLPEACDFSDEHHWVNIQGQFPEWTSIEREEDGEVFYEWHHRIEFKCLRCGETCVRGLVKRVYR